jgi:putative SOS response-associated peptidase YedK
MIMLREGKAYFHQLNSQEGQWEYVLAPEKYQQIDEALRERAGTTDASTPVEIAPTQRVVIQRVVGRELVPEFAFWTLVPPWVETRSEVVSTGAGEPRLKPPPRCHFNSRKDTLLKSSGWQRMLQKNRCVLWIDSFLEWSDEEILAGRQKLVGRFGLTCHRPMPVAGIWSTAMTQDGPVQTCSVVTCEPNSLLQDLPHHRMPAILLGDALHRWLDPNDPTPETVLHPTESDEFESRVVPAKQLRDLLTD